MFHKIPRYYGVFRPMKVCTRWPTFCIDMLLFLVLVFCNYRLFAYRNSIVYVQVLLRINNLSSTLVVKLFYSFMLFVSVFFMSHDMVNKYYNYY